MDSLNSNLRVDPHSVRHRKETISPEYAHTLGDWIPLRRRAIVPARIRTASQRAQFLRFHSEFRDPFIYPFTTPPEWLKILAFPTPPAGMLPKLDARLRRRKVTANEPDTKATLP